MASETERLRGRWESVNALIRQRDHPGALALLVTAFTDALEVLDRIEAERDARPPYSLVDWTPAQLDRLTARDAAVLRDAEERRRKIDEFDRLSQDLGL